MRALVTVKQVLDYNLRPRVKTDGSGIDHSNQKLSMNPFDERAVEEAVRLREKGKVTEVVVVSVGSTKAQDVLRTALAMGADRATLLHSDEVIEPLSIAKLLVKVVAEEKPQLVFLGKQAIDDDSNQVGQMLAALLNWPQGTFASKIEMEGNIATVIRETDDGSEEIELTLPAIITTELRLNSPRHTTMPDIARAKAKPLGIKSAGEYGVNITPRLETISVSEPAKRLPGVIVANVDELIVKLRELGA